MIRPAGQERGCAAPFVVLGGIAVIGGGLLSAATAPSASYHSSWAVAYIVLIAGVAQLALGFGQAALTDGRLPARVSVAELLAWNLGNVAVVAGTLLDVPAVLYLGCALLVAALALVLHAIRGAASGRLLLTTRVIVVVLLVSIPTGIVLQAIDHSG